MAHPSLPIILLAAGASSRMCGRDKLLEMVDDEPLIARQARMARAATDGPVIVALPPAPHPRYDALAGIDVTLLPVPQAAEGMNASLRTAFAALPADAAGAMLVLADLPDLDKNDFKKILQAYDPKSEILVWRGATEDGRPGHPILFKSDLFPAFAFLTGDGGGREVVAAAGGRVALIPLKGDRARMDLDTPKDWDRWRKSRQKE